MQRTNQGGSILSFIIVGGVLALLLVGGIYWVRQAQPSPDATPTAPTQPVTTPSPSSEGSANGTVDSPTGGNAAVNDGQASTSEPAATAPAAETAPTTTTNKSASTATDDSGAPGALPATGPAETAATVTALVLLVGASAAYLQSRRQRIGL